MVVEGQRELYGQLCKKLKEVERLAGIQGLLSWDEQVLGFVNLEARVTPRPLIHRWRAQAGDPGVFSTEFLGAAMEFYGAMVWCVGAMD